MKSLLGGVATALSNKTPVPYVGRVFGMPFGNRNDSTSQMRSFGSVGTVFAIVTSLANAVSQVEWHLHRPAAGSTCKMPNCEMDGVSMVERHAALDLWNRPNPFYTRQELVESFQQHLELTGEGWLVVGRNESFRSIPLELWPVRPDRMDVVPHPTDFLSGYVYTGPNGEKVPLDLDEVIQFRMPNPLDPYRGMGPVQAILIDLDSSRYSAEWNRNFFLNSAEPGGLIEFEEPLSDGDYRQFVERWREQHQGVNQAHRVGIIEGGKWKDRQFTMRDMQFAELREVSREVIREAWGYPKPMLGAVDDVNRANAEAGEYVFARWLIVSRLERIKGALNNDLLPLFGSTAAGLSFAYCSPVPANREADNAELTAKVQAAVALAGLNFDPAGVLAAVGLPEIPLAGDGDSSPRNVAEMIQKIYLGVDTVVTWEEARSILIAAGADLDPTAPQPAKAAPTPPGGNGNGRGERGPAGPPAAPADVAAHLVAHHLDKIRGPAGERGERGPAADAPAVAAVLAEHYAEQLRGPAGPRGEPGANGFRTSPGGSRPVLRAQGELDRALADSLAQVQDDWQEALEDLLDHWEDITAKQREQLVAQITAAVDSGDVAMLAALSADTPEGEELLTQAMVALALLGAASITREAKAQGVEDVPSAAPSVDSLRPLASASVAILASGLADYAGKEAMRLRTPSATGADVAASVAASIDTLSDRALRDQLGGSLSAAQNAGRFAALAAAPAADYYASEINDSNTCEPCHEIDAERFETLEAANEAYPNGGYIHCQGRNRCRGTLVAIWAGMTPPTKGELPAPVVPKAARAYHRDLEGVEGLSKTARAARRKSTQWNKLAGGQSSDVRLAVLADGRKVVHKRPPSWGAAADNKYQADAEQLAFRMAHRLDIPTAAVYRDSVDSVWVDFVEGRTVAELEFGPGFVTAQAERVASLSGRRLGLLDVLTGNSDRNLGNMIVDADDALVGIDHGGAWLHAVLGDPPGTKTAGAFDPTKPMSNYLNAAGWRGSDLSPADITETRRRLEGLREDFTLVGRSTWLDWSLAMLDLIAPYAKGKGSIYG